MCVPVLSFNIFFQIYLLVDNTGGAIMGSICGLWCEILACIFDELFFGGQGCFKAVCIPIVKDLL
jgi:hypothetical protein